ncbi:NEDD4-binding protein 2-like 1 isoform X2 [Lineus longissimus]|uniref:NEDD4-binding protein 2-like 1 isoform X2 n=1 Tax=Lineus longissimus TaxID=88925 RepID=UPI00315D1603
MDKRQDKVEIRDKYGADKAVDVVKSNKSELSVDAVEFVPGNSTGKSAPFPGFQQPSVRPKPAYHRGATAHGHEQGHRTNQRGRKSPSSSYNKQPKSTHMSVPRGFNSDVTRKPTTQADRRRHEPHRSQRSSEENEDVQLNRQFQKTSLEDRRGPQRKHTGCERAPGATGEMPADETQVQTVRQHLDKGDKLLIMMRGCPGSGKTTLASQLKFSGVILSTDDYFTKNGRYLFRKEKIGDAHQWNQKRALEKMKGGVNPIIIDNTNTQTWEMKPYVIQGIEHGYKVEIFEPNTPWKFELGELARRNSHDVPEATIKSMIERYEHKVTVDQIRHSRGKPKAKAVRGAYGRC